MSAEARAALLAKHVARSSAQASRLVRETPALYAAAHAPLVAATPPSALGWVHKILALEKETERLLHNAPGEDGFLLNVDPKVRCFCLLCLLLHPADCNSACARRATRQWSSHPDCGGERASWRGHAATRDMYVLGLCHRRDVASLRDLRAAHLPMLRAMRDAAHTTIGEVYGVAADQVRAFVHYPPQFYHFHVHFTGLGVCIGNGCFIERAHLLVRRLHGAPLRACRC